MEYLKAEDILQIHSIIMDEIGGTHGLRDRHIIASLEESPAQEVFGKEMYPNIFLKAAVYARAIVMNHPFVDGNKRTGMVCASIFLQMNGYRLVARKGGVEKFALRIVSEKLDLESIAFWFEKSSRKLNK